VERFIHIYFRLLRLTIVAGFAAMVAMVFANVFLRYVFNTGIPITEEFCRWLFVWVVFLGSIEALRNRAHIGLDSVISKLPTGGKKLCFVISHSLMLMVLVMLIDGSLMQVKLNWATEASSMPLSLSFLNAAPLPFCVSAALILLIDLWRLFNGTLPESALIGVAENEESSLQPAVASGDRP
jgi:TRAP-type C4-dicarboxylate transport system permease small subunit